MSNYSITLKINSYLNNNTILPNGEIIYGLSEYQNFKQNKPIIEFADKIITTVRNEFNSRSVDFIVSGNAFEQAFLKLKYACSGFTGNIETRDNTVSVPTEQRLAMLASNFPVTQRMAVGLNIRSDGYPINFPQYPLVDLQMDAGAPQILISSDVNYIRNRLVRDTADNFAFLINGQSEQFDGDRYIIGCTEENVSQLVQAYIETRYINPFVGRAFRQHKENLNFSDASSAQLALIDRIEPYFHLSGEKLYSIFREDEIAVGIHSISMDAAGNIRADAQEDLSRLLVRSSCNVVSVAQNNGFRITGLKAGSAFVTAVYDDAIPVVDFSVKVADHIYVDHIELSVDVPKWKKGESYPICCKVSPENAEDFNDIVIESSDPDIAYVKNGRLHVIGEGAFELTARAKYVSQSLSLKPEFFHVLFFGMGSIPEESQMRTDHRYSTHISLNGRNLRLSEVSWKVVKGQECIRLCEPEGNKIVFDTVKPGIVQFQGAWHEDPSITFTQEYKIKRQTYPWSYMWAALVCFFVEVLSCVTQFREPIITAIFYLPAVIFFLVAFLKHERGGKGMFIICGLIATIIMVYELAIAYLV